MTDTLLPSLQSDHRPADIAASIVAADLHAAEAAMDVLLCKLGQCLTNMAEGRDRVGVRPERTQRPLENFTATLNHATATRGALLDLHGSLARVGRRAELDWTLIMGPGETTPTDGEKDGIRKGG